MNVEVESDHVQWTSIILSEQEETKKEFTDFSRNLDVFEAEVSKQEEVNSVQGKHIRDLEEMLAMR